MSEKQVVYVVCGNDYPDSVFSTEAAAEAYVDAQREKDLGHARIYWRYYDFVVDGPNQ